MLLTNWLKSLTSRYRTARSRRPRNQRFRSHHRYQPALSRRPIGIEELEDRTLLTVYSIQNHLLPPLDSDTNLEEQFGTAVAVDENYLVVGAPGNDFHAASAGLAYVYKKDDHGTTNDATDDTWVFETTLSSETLLQADAFGTSVAIDGNTIVVGAYSVDTPTYNSGAVFIYTKDDSGWNNIPETRILSPEADKPTGSSFGTSVAIEGNTVVVGASFDDSQAFNSGAAYVFTNSGGGWENANVTKLTASDAVEKLYFGQTVSISDNTIVVGTKSYVSAAYIFSNVNNNWNSAEEVKLSGSSGTFGTTVSINGNTVVVGEELSSLSGIHNSGAVHLYVKGTDWHNYQETILTSPDPHTDDHFGSSVSIHDNILVVGDENKIHDQLHQGSIYIFERTETGWNDATVTEISPPEIELNQLFGATVSFDGNTILVGVPAGDINGIDSGAAYLFTSGGDGWNTSGQRISNLTDNILNHANDTTGDNVAIEGNYLVIGAPLNQYSPNHSGAVYIYERNTNGTPETHADDTWIYHTTLFATLGQDARFFGSSIDINGDNIAVGAFGSTELGYNSGTVYVFTKDGDDWLSRTETRITGSDLAYNYEFGYSVAIEENTLVVGSRRSTGNQNVTGAIYVFTSENNNWSNAVETKLFASNGKSGDYFGHEVDINGDSIIVSAWARSDISSQSGAVYIYRKGESGWSDAWETEFTPFSGSNQSNYGYSVSISGDSVAIGIPGDDEKGNNVGSAYIYTRLSENWDDSELTKIYAPDGLLFDAFGHSVSIHNDTLLVGTFGDDTREDDSGSVYVFKRNETGWENSFDSKLIADDGMSQDHFGWSIAHDGTTFVVGAPYDDTSHGYNSGSVYVYGPPRINTISINDVQITEGDKGTTAATFTITRTGVLPGDLNKNETVEFKIVDGTASVSSLDYEAQTGSIYFHADPQQTLQVQTISVEINGDHTIEDDEFFQIILTHNSENSIFIKSIGNATILNDDFPEFVQTFSALPTGIRTDEDHFGNAIEVSGDYMVVGEIHSDIAATDGGAAYVYIRNRQGTPDNESDDTWDYHSTLTAFDAEAGDQFGTSIAIDGDTIVIGSLLDDDQGDDSGSAYVYRLVDNVWSLEEKLTATDGREGDQFGISVSIEDSTIVVGARYHNYLISAYNDDTGSAYVFDRSGTDWTQTLKLTASNHSDQDAFGHDVLIKNDAIYITGLRAAVDDSPSGTGAIYIFHNQDGTWTEQQIIGPPDGEYDDWFGYDIHVDGNYLGAVSAADDGFKGSVYLFKNNGGIWEFQQKLTPPVTNQLDRSAFSIRISGTTLAIGSLLSDGQTTDSGAVFLYQLISGDWVESQTISALDGAEQDYFGHAVAFTGDQIIVGAPQNDEAGNNVGKVYVFRTFAPQINIIPTSQKEGDQGETIFTFEVERVGQSSGDLDIESTIDFETVDLSATLADHDYEFQSGRITFTADPNAIRQTQTIEITVYGDDIFEGDEKFVVRLSNPSDGTILGSNSVFGWIEEDDHAELGIENTTVNESAGTASITVSLDKPAIGRVSVMYSTADQTAESPTNYTSTTGTITFEPGELSKTIQVPITDNAIVEGNEIFLVNLTDLVAEGSDVIISQGQAEVTVTDDDQSNITIDDISVDESAANVQVTVSLDAPIDAPVVINYATASQTAQSPSDYAHKSGSLTFTPGAQTQTISIPIVDSGLLEIDETFLVILSGLQASGRNVILADDRAVVTILDDDSASAEVNLRVVSSPTPTQPDGSIIQLPEHETWISEWATWWIEIWVQTNDQTSQGSISVDVDLSYNSAVASAMEIEYGPRFSANQTGDIDDSAGMITGLHAETSTAGLQVNRRTLFARIRFTPQLQDQIDLNLSEKVLPAEDLELQANSVGVHLSNAAPFVTPIEAIPAVQFYANPYDLNNDDAINFRDLILFASVYNSIPSQSDSDYAWFADLNQDDRVNFRDLLLFASNYGKSKANQSIVTYPSNFPDAWNQLLMADTSSAPQQTATPLTQTVATTSFSRIIDQVSGSLSEEQNVILETTTVQVVDLEGDALGRVAGGTIYIDVDAAGYGWYLEGSPAADFNFVYDSDLSLIALPGSDADGRFDLQTVLFHELGHLLGYEHAEDGVMQDTLAPGIRLLPDWELNFEFDPGLSLDDTDDFFLDIQDETELMPFK